MNEFDKLAHAVPGWHGGSAQEIAPHTVTAANAPALARGYLEFLRAAASWRVPANNLCLDLGAGAGHITEAFNKAGLRMTASEHTDAGVAMIRELNPGLKVEKKNIASFLEPRTYDLVFAREIYAFTRVNAFEEQTKVVSNIVDSLKPGGAFLLVGSDVCHPNCMDYDRIIGTYRQDPRLRLVTGKHYEFIFKRLGRLIRGPRTARLIELALSPVVAYKRRRHGFARIYLIGFVKK
ncbi:MAG: class I SAM-dependent methyltransferase [Elusimicrobia bacterium]|nr:class I SAM-dependent methyltransferase [Elusimicrobiota bacterium]